MSRSLASVLEWSGESRAPYERCVEHLTAVASHLSAAISDLGRRFGCEARAGAVLATIGTLEENPLLRLLGAPECAWQVAQYHLQPTPDLLPLVETWIAIERVIDAGDDPDELDAPLVGWSAFGDEHFLPSLAESPTADPWGVASHYRAPVRHGIVIDFVSPAARRVPKCNEHRSIVMNAPVPMTPAEQSLSIERVTSALDLLEQTAPLAYRLVTSMTKVIVPRRDGVHPGYYTSASLRTAVGRTVLNNPFARGVTLPMLVSSLVHEAIHSYLYIEEQRHPLVTDWDRAFDVVVTSPWTGGALSLPTYLHACFVWHGLRTLWSQESLICAVGEAPAAAQREAACAGFLVGALSPIAGVRALVSPSVWQLVERMHHVSLAHAA